MPITPIFIMGAPRSGTTLLAAMLSSRADIIALPEMHYIHRSLRDEIVFKNLDKLIVFNSLKNHFMFKGLNIANEDHEIISLIQGSFKETVLEIIECYNQKYYHKRYKFWVEHSPHNHKHFHTLLYHFPNALFIHIIRDGRAVYSSTIEQAWGYKDVIRGASLWGECVSECMLLAKIYTKKVITIRYEDLTTRPENIMREICKFLKIEYDDSMLSADGLILNRLGKAFIPKKPKMERPNNNSLGKWKVILKESEIWHFTNVNRDYLEMFDYDVENFIGKKITGYRKLWYLVIGKLKYLYFRSKFKRLAQNN